MRVSLYLLLSDNAGDLKDSDNTRDTLAAVLCYTSYVDYSVGKLVKSRDKDRTSSLR